jgi:hypothetical protein
MTRPPRRSSSREAAGGFWIRACGQREPAPQGTGRLNRSALWLGWLKGGLDIPAPCAECGTLQREHPLRSLTRCAGSRAGRIGNARVASHRLLLYEDALPVVPQPIEEDPVHSAVPSGMADRSPEAPIPRSTRKVGLSDGKRPCRTASGPRWLMSQWPNSTGARAGSGRYAVQHNSRVTGTRPCDRKQSRSSGRL